MATTEKRCTTCDAIGRSRRICKNCGACKNCIGCKCISCGHCAKTCGPTSFCPRCQQCKEHHSSEILDAGEFPFRKCTYNYSIICTGSRNCECPKCKPSTNILLPLQRSLGVEIELGNFGSFARIDPHDYKSKLKFHFDHDGSVQGSGQELVTDPMQGDQYLYSMTWLIQQLKSAGIETNHTCGYHVHVDAIDLNPHALRRVLVAYALIQDQLYGTLIDSKRQSSQWGKTYCPPLPYNNNQLLELMDYSKGLDILNWFHQKLYNCQFPGEALKASKPEEYKLILEDVQRQIKELKARKYVNAARRSALNFHSWMMRGTIEFRLKEGTVDPTDLLMWPLWCGYFVEKISNLQDKELIYWFKKAPSLAELTEEWKFEPLQKFVALRKKAKSPKDEAHDSGHVISPVVDTELGDAPSAFYNDWIRELERNTNALNNNRT